MLVTMLGSGSSGNSTYIYDNGQAILVDCGFSLKSMKERANDKGIDLKTVSHILITHPHIDHWLGAYPLAEEVGATVVFRRDQYIELYNRYNKKNDLISSSKKRSNRGDVFLKENVLSKYKAMTLLLEHEWPERIASFNIRAFEVEHDTVSAFGFVLWTEEKKKVGIATDLGIITETVRRCLYDCSIVIIESNHDLKMLHEGPYPQILKDRIDSDTGHLSNNATASFIKDLDPKITKNIILAHASKENNSLKKIEETYAEIIPNSIFFPTDHKDRVKIHLADQKFGSSIFHL